MVAYRIACQIHPGGEIKTTAGSFNVKGGGVQQVNSRMWRWRTVLGAQLKRAGEHISALECRAALLAFRWRARQSFRQGCRFLHLVDSRVTMGAIGKGRSASFRLRHIIKQVPAVSLAANFLPVVGFTRSHTNPADKPSRRKVINRPLKAASLSQKQAPRALRRD